MENIFLPTKIEYQTDTKNKNKGSIIIKPCWPGYGITWGNTLRRVLLTSLPGAAVTAVKIKGVKYEFSTIPYIQEDVLEIILNLKVLRLRILSPGDEPVKLTLKASGEKKVKAADIDKSADVEIVNPDLLIATLTDKKANLEMEIWVVKGYGWAPSEEKSRAGLDIGTIVVDSMFSPVLQVSVNVENIRVGKRTDFDKIILGIETDGAFSPFKAFLVASELLTNQFKALVQLGEEIEKVKKRKPRKAKKAKKVSKAKKTKKPVKKTKKPVKKTKKIVKKKAKKAKKVKKTKKTTKRKK
ncbi:DNA-directed RNA polymerase subunit alpha [Patescibacteria group bacterium]|nr:DNA-directed RNA polymerase subunit alpha [Patescibacteria group bacterium]